MAVGRADVEPRIYLASARHVVERSHTGSIIFLRNDPETLGPAEPKVFEYYRERFCELWYYPQERSLDVAITPLSFGELHEAIKDVGVAVVPLTRGPNPFLDAPHAHTHNFEEVLFVGYPEGLWDPDSGFPIVRRGVTATPLKSNYRGSPTFLIDGAVYRGCSGGGVVVIERELVVPSNAQSPNASWGERIREEDRVAFLGMILDVFKRPDSEEPWLNLGIVLKAHKLFEVIREYERLTGRSA